MGRMGGMGRLCRVDRADLVVLERGQWMLQGTCDFYGQRNDKSITDSWNRSPFQRMEL